MILRHYSSHDPEIGQVSVEDGHPLGIRIVKVSGDAKVYGPCDHIFIQNCSLKDVGGFQEPGTGYDLRVYLNIATYKYITVYPGAQLQVELGDGTAGEQGGWHVIGLRSGAEAVDYQFVARTRR